MKGYPLFYFFLLSLVMLNQHMIAQELDERIWYNTVTIQPSPNAASLGKYGDIMVDKSTGIPNISIPMLDLNEGGIEVRIALSYHAGGIKVEEEASCVGLGWSLLSGGVITRIVHGMPDDGSQNGYLSNASKIPRESWVEKDFLVPIYEEDVYQWLHRLSLGQIDFEPDLFYYNIGQYSGSFMFGNHGDPILLPFADISIQPVFDTIRAGQNGLAGFILIDPNGIQYFFGNINASGFVENTLSISSDDNVNRYISSYYLSKIYNPFSDSEVTFQYTNYDYEKTTQDSFSILYESYPGVSNYSQKTVTSSGTSVYLKTKIISKIEFNRDTVYFFSSSSDENLPKMDSIIFKERSFKFDYGWFNSNGGDNHRLKLLSVIEKGDNYPDTKVHTFIYNDIQLPSYNSYSVDHWGYYNNKLNTSLIPSVKIGNQYLGGGANRNPDPNFTKAGMLSKISYPTGGWTEYLFENNTCYRNPMPDEISHDSTLVLATSLLDTTFSINLDPDLVYYDIFITAQLTGSKCSCSYPIDQCQGEFILYNSYNESFGHSLPIVTSCDYSINDIVESSFFKPPLTLQIWVEGSPSPTMEVSIYYRCYNPDDLNTKSQFITGGIRINSITSYDSLTGKSMIRSFDYGEGGILTKREDISYYTRTSERRKENPNDPDYTEFPQIFVYSHPQGGLGLSSNVVSYNQVTEYIGTSTNNKGKIITEFYEILDPFASGPPFPPKVSYQYLRSNIKKEIFCSSENDTVRMNEYNYEIDTNRMEWIIGFQAFRKRTNQPGVIPMYDKKDFIYKNYWIQAYPLRKKTIINTEYQSDGDKIVRIDTLYYDSLYHINPNKVKSTRSDGKILTTVYKYPLDYTLCKNYCSKQMGYEIKECEASFSQCSREFEVCMSKLNYCYYQLAIDCLENALHDNEECGTKFCQKKVTGDYNKCLSQIDPCLDSSGYYDCLDTAQCYNIKCLTEAMTNYYDCNKAYDSCLSYQYDHSTNDNERGIILMAQMHNHNSLVEKEVYLEDVKIEHYKFDFKTKKLEFSYSDTLVIFDFPVIYSAEIADINGIMFKEMQYDEYDDHLNIVELTPKGIGPSVVYLWGYNYTYPVAKIENANYNQVIGILGKSPLNITYEQLQSKNSEELEGIFQILRDHEEMKESLVYSYTYSPLDGMTSETSPNGIKTKYDYDDFGRLSLIRDNDLNILKHIEYNYATGQNR